MTSTLSNLFWDLLSTAKQVFRGIFDAIVAGRWDLAGQIAMAGLKLAWRQGVASGMNLWAGFRAWMISLFADMFATLTTNLASFLQGFVDLYNGVRAKFKLDAISVPVIQKIMSRGQTIATAIKAVRPTKSASQKRWAKLLSGAAQAELNAAVKKAARARAGLGGRASPSDHLKN